VITLSGSACRPPSGFTGRRTPARSGPPERGRAADGEKVSRGKHGFPPRHFWRFRTAFTITCIFVAGWLSTAHAAPPGALIENQARIEFVTPGGEPDSRLSNTVSVTTAVVRSPSTVEFTRVLPAGGGIYTESVGPSACFDGSVYIPLANPQLLGGNVIDPSIPQSLNVSPVYNLGEPVFIRLTDLDQNLDFQQTETVDVRITSLATGDVETLRLTETGTNTGVFAGYVPSAAAAPVNADCTLQAAANTELRVDYTDSVDVSDSSNTLAIVDPTQRVFETQTGSVVSGSLIELVDAATGQPATVFGNDGTSRFPSAIESGGTVTDSGGTVYVFAPGEFRFPVVADGDYRLVVTPPPQFVAPSALGPAEIQGLPGAPYDIGDASFGRTFTKSGGLSFAADIPLDRNSSQLFLQKQTRTTTAATGDFIRFELTLENSGAAGVASDVIIEDTLPREFNYVPGSSRLGGSVIDDPETDAATGLLRYQLDNLVASERVTLAYVVEVVAAEQGKQLVNRATAFAAGGLASNEAQAAVAVTEDLFRSTATLVGRIVEGDCAADTNAEDSGVAGITVYLEDGRYAVSDAGGRFHFEGLPAGTHVAQLDRFTVPDYFDVVGCSDNAAEAGRADSQFVRMSPGSLKHANFYLKRKPAPEGRIELELSASGGDDAESVDYRLTMDGIGNVAISNIDLMVVLPDGMQYDPGTMRIDGVDLGDPRLTGPALSMALPDDSGNWTRSITFAATIDDTVDGELATKAIATFDTPIESRQRTPVAETRMLREPATVKNASYVLDLKFDVLSDELSVSDMAALDAMQSDWAGVRDVRIIAIGHSDSQRIAARNRDRFADNYALSKARALSAASYLGAALGVSADAIEVTGRGPDDPVASNATAEGRQQNRRVEMIVSGIRPSRPSFLEVTKARSGTLKADTKGAVPGTELVVDERFQVDPEAGTPKSQPDVDVNTLKPGVALLHPAADFLPAIPATRVSIQHAPGQRVELTVNGQSVSALNFDRVVENRRGTVAISRWRTVPLVDGDNRLRAQVIDRDGNVVETIKRRIVYSGAPVRAEVLKDRSNLIADGRVRPAIAIRLYDRNGQPARPGMTGQFRVRDPYRSWFDVEEARANQLVRVGDRQSFYRIGKDGIAFIELEPTTRSGEVIVELEFENQREQVVRSWLSPIERDWILVGFAEGTAAWNTLSDNTLAAEQSGFEDGYVDEGRVAFFAKGQITGETLLTIAYDSDRERDRSTLATVVDPDAFYPLYADLSEQRFEAASQRKLYVKLERRQFVALFGDMDTGLSVAELARFERRMNGFKAEFRGENLSYSAFAAETAQAFNRDEIRGDGTSGLYRLSRAPIVQNSETIRIEVRDRLDSGVVLETRSLTRFLDYNLDPLNGTIFFKEPIRSRDESFNPIIIVAEYESQAGTDDALVAGGRLAASNDTDTVEVGTTFVTDDTAGAESELSGVDFRWQVTPETLLRAEYAKTESTVGGVSQSGSAHKVELEHTSSKARVRAFIREMDGGFGLGQQATADRGVRRLGVEGEGQLTDTLSLRGEAAWQQQLDTGDIRNLARATLAYESAGFNASMGFVHAEDEFEDGQTRGSDLAEFGVARKIFNNRVLLRASTTTAMGDAAGNSEFPDSLVIGADIRLTDKVELVTEYEHAEGEGIDAQMSRVGLRATPWQRAQLATTVTNEVGEFGPRLFANVGLVQGFQLSERWLFDIGLDQSNTLVDDRLRQFDEDRTLPSGSVSDDFVAGYAGAMYNAELWSANARVEHRNSDMEERNSLLFGWFREPVRGHGLSAGLTVFDATGVGGRSTSAADLSLGWAWRLADSRWTFLDRADLEYEDVTSPTDSQQSWRFINNFNANRRFGERMQLSLQYAFKFVRSEFDGDAYEGYTDLVGVDLRRNLGSRFDIGVSASMLTSWESGVRDYSSGFDVGFNVADNMWLSVGYNLAGFDDDDLREARYTAQGPFVRFSMKADQSLLKAIAGRR